MTTENCDVTGAKIVFYRIRLHIYLQCLQQGTHLKSSDNGKWKVTALIFYEYIFKLVFVTIIKLLKLSFIEHTKHNFNLYNTNWEPLKYNLLTIALSEVLIIVRSDDCISAWRIRSDKFQFICLRVAGVICSAK